MIIIIIILIIILCLPLAVYIALMLVHPSKCLKQIIQKKLNRVKNRNWLEANQLAILQAWSTIWTLDYREQIQLAFRAGLEFGASELQFQRPNRSATLPPQVPTELTVAYVLFCSSYPQNNPTVQLDTTLTNNPKIANCNHVLCWLALTHCILWCLEEVKYCSYLCMRRLGSPYSQSNLSCFTLYWTENSDAAEEFGLTGL